MATVVVTLFVKYAKTSAKTLSEVRAEIHKAVINRAPVYAHSQHHKLHQHQPASRLHIEIPIYNTMPHDDRFASVQCSSCSVAFIPILYVGRETCASHRLQNYFNSVWIDLKAMRNKSPCRSNNLQTLTSF